MYTSITLSGYNIFNKLKVLNLTHRAAYRATLKLVLQNIIPYGCSEVKLMKIEHPERNYSRLLLLADGQFSFNVYINTYEP